MPTAIAAAFIPRPPLLTAPPPPPPFLIASQRRQPPLLRFSSHQLTRAKPRTLAVVASSSLDPSPKTPKQSLKKKVILNLVQVIEPLDVSVIQKDVPAITVDAMKRTISGMLGLLPSDQFRVEVEAFWGPLSKLLISSLKTGYTLQNAELRLCLERNFDIHDREELPEDGNSENVVDGSVETSEAASSTMLPFSETIDIFHGHEKNNCEASCDIDGIDGLGELTPKVREYILYLQSRLDCAEKGLHEIKGKTSALHMQQLVGEEKNDLLDYLRSLPPEKVAELSRLACPEVNEIIHSIVHGLLATLSPRVHTKPPRRSENATSGPSGAGEDDCAELVENTFIQFQPLISVPRDYLARLLFWCMLLGHYIRGLEYRLDLMELLTLAGDA